MIFTSPAFDDHEQVVFVRDAEAGLRAIVALHDTTLGPAVGGCRMWPYASEAAALDDVLRLATAMTKKCVMAGLPFGGGKSVILGDARRDKTPELLRAFGRAVERLGGRYVAAEDVGIGIADLEIAGEETTHLAGLARGEHASGDPAPFTALGTLVGIETAVRHRLGVDTMAGLRVAVQGVGSVGRELCRLLADAGARLVVADVDERAAVRVAAERGAEIAAPGEILARDVDVFAPCALGGGLDESAVASLRAAIVAGCANNPLASPECGDALWRRGILYAPDYVVSAGGVINGCGEILGSYDPEAARRRIVAIGETLRSIFDRAASEDRPPHRVADDICRERLEAARAARREGAPPARRPGVAARPVAPDERASGWRRVVEGGR